MRVAVVAEFYPRRHDPVLGVWAHRQALAARDAGAQVEVFVLHRLVGRSPAAVLALARQPRVMALDGVRIHYMRYVSPPRMRSYARWSAWAAPALRRAMRRHGPFDLVHAHYAVPAGDAVLRAGVEVPLVVSVHGGDVLWTATRVPGGRRAVERVFGCARGSCWPTAPGSSGSRASTARATRAWCTSAPISRPAAEPAPSRR